MRPAVPGRRISVPSGMMLSWTRRSRKVICGAGWLIMIPIAPSDEWAQRYTTEREKTRVLHAGHGKQELPVEIAPAGGFTGEALGHGDET